MEYFFILPVAFGAGFFVGWVLRDARSESQLLDGYKNGEYQPITACKCGNVLSYGWSLPNAKVCGLCGDTVGSETIQKVAMRWISASRWWENDAKRGYWKIRPAHGLEEASIRARSQK